LRRYYLFEINKKLSNISGTSENPQAKPLNQVRTKLRKTHYNQETEEAYIGWIKTTIISSQAQQRTWR